LFSGGSLKPKIDLNQLFFYGGLTALFIGLVLQYSIGVALIVVGAIVSVCSYWMAWKMATSQVTDPEKSDAA
jgi:membrane protein implicated in regulation of membrane protease activity